MFKIERSYVANMGCNFARKAVVGYFFLYGAVILVGLRPLPVPRYMRAMMLWNERWFNAVLCAATGGATHCLIRLDKDPCHRDPSVSSHIVAARFNFGASCWEI